MSERINRFRDLVNKRTPPEKGPTKNDIVTDGAFRVGIISLDDGQEIESHPEEYAVFFYVLEGNGEFATGDGNHELTEGNGLYLDSGEPRGIRCIDPLTILGVRMGVQDGG